MDFGTLVQLLNQVAPGLGDAAAQTLGPQEQQVLLQIFQDAESQQPGSGVQGVAQALVGRGFISKAELSGSAIRSLLR